MCFPYLERSLSLLNPWLIQLDLDASKRIGSCNDPQMNYLLQELSRTEHNMASATMNSNQLDLAEGPCRRCLSYSRRYGLEERRKPLLYLQL
jgi:hypothetical protein